MHECYRLLLIACTLPITSAEAERSFFLLRRLKTSARSTMAEDRLVHLSVIAMHYKNRVPADEVCTNHPQRLFIQSLFERDIVAP